MIEIMKKPAFWIAIAIAGAVAYAIWQHSENKAEDAKKDANTAAPSTN